jgi:hypothetical protein
VDGIPRNTCCTADADRFSLTYHGYEVDLTSGGPKDPRPALSEFIQPLGEIFTLGKMSGNFALKAVRGGWRRSGLGAVEQQFVDCLAGTRNAGQTL